VTVKTLKMALVLAGLAFGTSANAAFTPITLVSGNGSIGGTDSLVSFTAGPSTGEFTTLPFTPGTTAAQIVSPNQAWTSIAGAKWVSTVNTGNAYGGVTALYSINFSTAGLGAGVPLYLSGLVAADDTLTGIYVDGHLISGTSGATYTSASTIATTDISSLLSAGTSHTLYFDDNQTVAGSAAGVLFSVTLTTVPEPSSLAMVGIAGLMGVGALVRRKRSIA
jgi:hypothetical protein